MGIVLPRLTLVMGGAASGKSKYAETLVISSDKPHSYIATAQAYDAEMVDKISKHQVQRGADWQTYETPLNPWDALGEIAPSHVVLLDCATFWLTNVMLGEHDNAAEKEKLFSSFAAFEGSLVVVSNEVGQGVVPDNKLARQFRQAQGELNQELAAKADLVVFVTAGLPQVLKGQLPS